MNDDPFKWRTGDTLKSIHGVFLLGRNALAKLLSNIGEFSSRVDERNCNKINRAEDEL